LDLIFRNIGRRSWRGKKRRRPWSLNAPAAIGKAGSRQELGRGYGPLTRMFKFGVEGDWVVEIVANAREVRGGFDSTWVKVTVW